MTLSGNPLNLTYAGICQDPETDDALLVLVGDSGYPHAVPLNAADMRDMLEDLLTEAERMREARKSEAAPVSSNDQIIIEKAVEALNKAISVAAGHDGGKKSKRSRDRLLKIREELISEDQ